MNYEKIANDFLQENFNIELSIPIRLNGRLKRNLGRYLCLSDGTPLRIEIAKDHIKYYTQKEVVDTLKHECVHYALHMLGLPFGDGDDYFEDTLKRLGVCSTGTMKHKGLTHVYNCDCKEEHLSITRFNVNRYRCGNCRGKFTYVGQKIIQ